ncbi:CpaD family pilus assembly lipoprotein [Vibrio sp. TBV020]|uniref:CpaD family pilus assembly lipoprotein n=1 Tax=Vibrio sp. TBV020 TaxID=3137398 RepID=UPI0038CD9421
MNMIKYILPALVLLGGCTSSPIEQAPALDVVSVTNKLTIKLDSAKISSGQEKAIRQYIERKGSPYGLTVKLLTHTTAGQQQLDTIESLIIGQGVARNKIYREHTSEKNAGDIQILIESFRAKLPKCVTQKHSNNFINRYKTHPAYGCANSTALAQMVANPKDLIVGEQLGPTNGAKAVSVIEGYVAPPVSTGNASSGQDVNTTAFGVN